MARAFSSRGSLLIKDGVRTADIKALGTVHLFRIDAAFQQCLSDREKLIWALTLSDVVNLKLAQATKGRSELRSSRAHQLDQDDDFHFSTSSGLSVQPHPRSSSRQARSPSSA